MTARPAYFDSASTRAANARLWQAIRREFGVGPGRLDRKTDPHITWTQLKRETSLAQHLRLIATARPTPGLPCITSRTENTGPL